MQTTETTFTKEQLETIIKEHNLNIYPLEIEDLVTAHELTTRIHDKDGKCQCAEKIVTICVNNLTPRKPMPVAYRFRHTDMSRDFVRTVSCGCHQGDIDGFRLESVESLLLDNVQ